MVYTSKNKLASKKESKDYCFLAGSIDFTLKDSWREKVIKEMGELVHFFDPTRTDHDELNDSQMKAHINWELDAMILADKILLNFLSDFKSPISLVELGLYVKSSKLIVVCPDQFYQKRYVEMLCKKYKTPFFNSLNEAIKYIKESLV